VYVHVDVDVAVVVDVDVDVVVNVVLVVVVFVDEPAAPRSRYTPMFGFQRLDAYRAATELLAATSALASTIPRGHGDLVDQLRRAALSVPLNIAEGSGKFGRDAARFYGIARGSALECAAILDALEAMGIVEGVALENPRRLLERIVSMLTGLVRP
jgi:four helix bundle protein